jgi:sporulation protein YlmC with PRC-barrel domain
MGRLPVLCAALLLTMAGSAHSQSQNQSKLPPKSVTPKEAPKVPTPPPHVVKRKEQADSLLGKEVYGTDGQQMGLVTNVLIDREGHPIALVIDFGGFLGVGSRKIAVDWHLMQFHPGNKDKPVTLSLTKDQLKSAPEYRPNKSTAPVIYAPAPAPLPAKPATAATPSSKPPAATPDHNEPK